MSPLEPYQQTYTYDLGNNLTSLAHQANNDIWQQTITIHPNSNRGTENNGQNNFDANGNLLNLDNIGNLDWHYNVWLGFCVLSLLLLLRIWVPMCRVLLCCFVSLVEMSNKGR
jgi:insecticidal toxin complex protein TccC